MHEVTADEEDDGSVESDAIEHEPAWCVHLDVSRSNVCFKIDCGADGTVVSKKTYPNLRGRSRLKLAKLNLETLGGPLMCKGQYIDQIHRSSRLSSYAWSS